MVASLGLPMFLISYFEAGDAWYSAFMGGGAVLMGAPFLLDGLVWFGYGWDRLREATNLDAAAVMHARGYEWSRWWGWRRR